MGMRDTSGKRGTGEIISVPVVWEYNIGPTEKTLSCEIKRMYKNP